MSPEELLEWVRKRPFVPFKLFLTDGQTYDIRHPEFCMVGKRSAMIGIPGQPGDTLYERATMVALLHIVRIEPLEPAETGQVSGG